MPDQPPPPLPPPQQPKTTMPAMAFVSGMLLPHGSFHLEMSQIAPGTCRLIVVRSPQLPPHVAALVERAAGPDGEKSPELWARVFSCVIANIHGAVVPVLMEMAVTAVLWSRGKSTTESKAD